MQEQCSAAIREIDAATLHQLLDSQEESPPLLIDVRQPQEFAQGHIPGALLIPLGQLELPHPALTDTARPIVVYCRSGKRSMVGAKILCARGFGHIMSLQDGILGWPYAMLAGAPKEVLDPGEAKSVQEILLHAMGRELRAQNFYRQWLSQTDEEVLKITLQELASREEEHMAAIYERYLAWCRENVVTPLTGSEFREKASISQDEHGYSTEQTSVPPSFSQEDLLELAVEKELEAYNFYKTSAEMINSVELRELLFTLSFEERVHAASLLKLLK